MKVLVTGVTGTVGGEVVKALLQRGGCAGFDTQAAQARYVSWCGRDRSRFAALLGHQPRTYTSFAEELAKEWAAA